MNFHFPPLSVLLSASGSLKVLSKARCVESYSFEKDVQYRVLRPWPSKPGEDQEAKNWLAKNGILPDEKLRVQAYSIGYSEYKKYKPIRTPQIDKIRAERNVVTTMIIASRPESVQKIACIWDKDNDPNREYPVTTADEASIRKFGQHGDAMLGFRLYDTKDYFKMPAFLGPLLFQYAGLLPNAAIIPEGMEQSAGSNTDSQNRSQRHVVHRDHRGYLISVLNKTMKSTTCFDISRIPWIEKIRKASIAFHARKHA